MKINRQFFLFLLLGSFVLACSGLVVAGKQPQSGDGAGEQLNQSREDNHKGDQISSASKGDPKDIGLSSDQQISANSNGAENSDQQDHLKNLQDKVAAKIAENEQTSAAQLQAGSRKSSKAGRNAAISGGAPLATAGNSPANSDRPANPDFSGRFYRSTTGALQNSLGITPGSDPEPGADPAIDQLPLVGGQARGYLMLYAMQPQARRTVEAQVAALRVAGIDHLFLGVLIDGTFGRDLPYLRNLIREINSYANRLTLNLYLTNGSTMRRFNTTSIAAGFNQIDPIKFRNQIKTDQNLREQFRNYCREAAEIFKLNSSLNTNNQNNAVVMLEDNLKADSYQAMRSIAAEVFDQTVTIMRNPCPNCYAGNDIESGGDPIELHDFTYLTRLEFQDGFSNDGTNFHFPSESPGPKSLSYGDLQRNIEEAARKELSYFALWRRQRQGINGVTPNTHPNDRNYEIPDIDMLAQEVQLLRSGLRDITQ